MEWWKAHYDRPLERSVWVGCPFQSRPKWVETKWRRLGLFAESVEIGERLQGGSAYVRAPYLHPLRIPLAGAVSKDEASLESVESQDSFGIECEGHCGV